MSEKCLLDQWRDMAYDRNLSKEQLESFWGKYFTNFQIAPFLYVVFAVLLVIIGMVIYQRHQVQAR
mgnify:CR=1 FL=1